MSFRRGWKEQTPAFRAREERPRPGKQVRPAAPAARQQCAEQCADQPGQRGQCEAEQRPEEPSHRTCLVPGQQLLRQTAVRSGGIYVPLAAASSVALASVYCPVAVKPFRSRRRSCSCAAFRKDVPFDVRKTKPEGHEAHARHRGEGAGRRVHAARAFGGARVQPRDLREPFLRHGQGFRRGRAAGGTARRRRRSGRGAG